MTSTTASAPASTPDTETGAAQNQRVLLIGARGFVGRHLLPRLVSAGYTVQAAGRNGPLRVDYAQLHSAEQWLPLLQNIDVVVNAAGMLRSTPGNAIEDVHERAPIALFDACAQSSVRQVVQISALGVDGNETAYARTKRAADRHLLALAEHAAFGALIIRPSLIFGNGGASTQLFMNLARMPWLFMPRPMLTHNVQPIAVADLCDAIVRLMQNDARGIVELGGPRPLTMAALVASLRQQMGMRAAMVQPLPDSITRLSARCGDYMSVSPWCSASLEMASHDNCCDPQTATDALGRATIAPEHLLATLTRL